jgi:fused signal recognition particle receptor
MSTPWFRRVSEGLTRTRDELSGHLNLLLRRGPDLDARFWDDLEDALIAADMGMPAVSSITGHLRDAAARKALPDAEAVIDHLVEELTATMEHEDEDFLRSAPLTVLVTGVNGSGKTTTVGKLAREIVDSGRTVLIGSADTYRAAAIEQLDVWAKRARVPVVSRERGADPAAVAYDTLSRARHEGVDVTLIDTAGRLHTARDLMAELEKIGRVVRRESAAPVRTLLVMDATTGQNGILQARNFSEANDEDGIVLTKLDGTAKGGIAVAIMKEMDIPILRIGVGEGLDDLKPFDAHDFARALIESA